VEIVAIEAQELLKASVYARSGSQESPSQLLSFAHPAQAELLLREDRPLRCIRIEKAVCFVNAHETGGSFAIGILHLIVKYSLDSWANEWKRGLDRTELRILPYVADIGSAGNAPTRRKLFDTYLEKLVVLP